MFVIVKDNVVESIIQSLPECTESVSGFKFLSSPEQIEHGYYPLVEIKPMFNQSIEKLADVPVYVIGADDVTATYGKIALTTEEVSEKIEIAKADKTAKINLSCATEIIGGFVSMALGAEHRYTATLEDQANLLGLIAIGMGGDFTCADIAGVKARRAHTLAQLKQVLADGGAFKDLRLAKARLLKDRIAAAPNLDLPDAAAVDALTW